MMAAVAITPISGRIANYFLKKVFKMPKINASF
jgi:hypothetical protein